MRSLHLSIFMLLLNSCVNNPRFIEPVGELQETHTFGSYTVNWLQTSQPGSLPEGFVEVVQDGRQVFALHSAYVRKPEGIKVGRDITGDSVPNLTILEYTGGAHCCTFIHILELGSTFRELQVIAAEDSDPDFKDLDGAPGLEIILHDWTFNYWHTDHASSPAPEVVLRFENGLYRVAPDLMRKPAPNEESLRAMVEDIHQKSGQWPTFPHPALWGHMLDLIYAGNLDSALELLDLAWSGSEKEKQVFLEQFLSQLESSPYWNELKASSSKGQ